MTEAILSRLPYVALYVAAVILGLWLMRRIIRL
jgi:hypothetical protein